MLIWFVYLGPLNFGKRNSIISIVTEGKRILAGTNDSSSPVWWTKGLENWDVHGNVAISIPKRLFKFSVWLIYWMRSLVWMSDQTTNLNKHCFLQSLLYLPFAIANALTATLNDGYVVFLLLDTSRLLLVGFFYCSLTLLFTFWFLLQSSFSWWEIGSFWLLFIHRYDELLK